MKSPLSPRDCMPQTLCEEKVSEASASISHRLREFSAAVLMNCAGLPMRPQECLMHSCGRDIRLSPGLSSATATRVALYVNRLTLHDPGRLKAIPFDSAIAIARWKKIIVVLSRA